MEIEQRLDGAKKLFVVVVHNHDGSEVQFDFIFERDAIRFVESLKFASEHRLVKKEGESK
jgi:hypothetical protein